MKSKTRKWIIAAAVLVVVIVCSFCFAINKLNSHIDEQAEVEFENPKIIEQMQEACYAGNEERFEFLVAQIKSLYPDSADSEMADIYVDIMEQLKKEKEGE